MHKFLIIQTAFIGDVVLATAVAEDLKLHFPEARIDMLLRKGNESLLSDHPFIGKVWIWNKKKNKLRNLIKLAKEIRREEYDDVINLQRFFSSGLLTVLSGAKTKRGFNKNPLSAFFDIKRDHIMTKEGLLHEIERNKQLIEDITGQSVARPKLYPSEIDYEKVKHLRQNSYICCAPASVWHTKQYPKSHWTSFINAVPAEIDVYLLGGPGDQKLCQEIISDSAHLKARDLSGSLSFLESAALMKGALMNYVNDSAPMHFASAVNAPVTAIYCSTVTNFGFGPLSDKKHVVEIDYDLYCRPCGLHGYKSCPQKHFKCAHDIPHNRLIEILNEC